jgi:hypothetical protein
MDERGTIEDIPKFGVPERIPRSDVPFVVAAGLALLLFCMTAVSVIVEALGLSVAEDTWASTPLTLCALGLGPALAYYFGRGLVATGIARGFGCLALVGFWALVLVVWGFGGPLAGVAAGVLAMGAAASYLLRRIRRRRQEA